MAIPEPIGKQQEVVCLGVTGHHIVLGTAGSGKTTMAITRAKYLADPRLPGHGRVLLVTFNKALSRYIRHIADQLGPNIVVENYHLFARGYLHARGLMGQRSIVPTTLRDALIEQAVVETAAIHKENLSFFQRNSSFFRDEIRWIAGQNISSLKMYVEIRRVGRADANLKKAVRPLMWEIRDRYLALRGQASYQYDLDDIAAAVSATLDTDAEARRYQHIIIDEGQDLSPEMIRSLAKAVPNSGSITFFGDVAQRIYGKGMSFRDAGLDCKAIWQFAQNYRNTRSIARLGLAIAQMPYYAGETDMVEPLAPTADGPKPTLIKHNDAEIELKTISDIARQHSEYRSVVILCRTHELIRSLKPYLPANAFALRDENDFWVDGAGLFYGTYHAAKGLEFDMVILPFLANGLMPSTADIEVEEEDAFSNDGRLLYVGVTRARAELVLSYFGTPSPLIPTDSSLFLVHKAND